VAQFDLIPDMSEDMEKSIGALQNKFGQMRTGRASVSLLDSVRIDYYGSKSPLNQVATVAAPEPRLLTISPWEKSMVEPIEKAILKSDLGLNPMNDGKIIRIPIPELTGERRKDLGKLVHKEGEAGRVAIRQIRREYNDMIKSMEKDKDISEDESRRMQSKVQETTDTFIKSVDNLVVEKEKELNEL